MYALIRVDYDWYRFENLIAVSQHKEKLKELAHKENKNCQIAEYDPIKDPYQACQSLHYWIRKVKAL